MAWSFFANGLLIGFGWLAFLAWAAALPDTPFRGLHDQASQFGAFAVVVLGLLMPGVAQLVGLVDRS